jgi:hypothetical protein
MLNIRFIVHQGISDFLPEGNGQDGRPARLRAADEPARRGLLFLVSDEVEHHVG